MSEILTLQIQTGGAAFEDEPATELARILRVAANRIENGESHFILRDVNGNGVGEVNVEAE